MFEIFFSEELESVFSVEIQDFFIIVSVNGHEPATRPVIGKEKPLYHVHKVRTQISILE